MADTPCARLTLKQKRLRQLAVFGDPQKKTERLTDFLNDVIRLVTIRSSTDGNK